MHEHLDAFGIINMNGRVYNPLTAQFLSPDPFVQSPDNWANYNRYGYCLNNPLIYSDPSGYKLREANDNYRYDPALAIDQSYSVTPSIGQGDYLSWLRDSSWGGGGGPMRYFYAPNGNYYNEHGNQVTYDEVKNNYILPNAWLHATGDAAGNVFSSYVHGDDYTKRALNSIGISVQDAINALPNSLGIMVSLSQEFANANSGKFAITTMNGTELMMTTDQLIGGLEIASKFTLYGGIGIEAGIAYFGSGEAQVQAKQNFWSDTMVSISLYTISVAGCGVPALILSVGWVMYRNHVFDGMLDQRYYQNNYRPNNYTPNDAIPQYPLKDGPQPIYYNH